MPLMQGVPRSGHADVGEEQHRPRHNRPEVGHHKVGAAHTLQMLGVRARPDGPDDQIWSANDHRDDDQFTYRHLDPNSRRSVPSTPTMLMAILAYTSTFS